MAYSFDAKQLAAGLVPRGRQKHYRPGGARRGPERVGAFVADTMGKLKEQGKQDGKEQG